jgi:hypothetical protein
VAHERRPLRQEVVAHLSTGDRLAAINCERARVLAQKERLPAVRAAGDLHQLLDDDPPRWRPLQLSLLAWLLTNILCSLAAIDIDTPFSIRRDLELLEQLIGVP